MKKTGKTLKDIPSEKAEGKVPVEADDPIIHNESPDFAEDIEPFALLDVEIRNLQKDYSEELTAISYKELKVTSLAFKNMESIPSKYTCDGDNLSPALEIDGIPNEAKCLALIVDDPDAPTKTWVHCLAWNIPVTHHIKENIIHGKLGINDFKRQTYGGPCPPSGTHRYFFKVYALDALLNLNTDIKKPALEKAMSGHIIGFGQLIGTYKRMK